jgi:hypothetical protein
MTTRPLRFALALAVLLPAATVSAQREGYSYLSYVGTEVSLVSRAEDDSSARLNTPILAGDRVVTGSASRAEAILADGSVLRIDVQTRLRFDRLANTYEAEDDQTAFALEMGAVSLEQLRSTSRATRIDTDDATILFHDKGLLRVETGKRGTEIYVVSGWAEVNARSGRATLRAGQYAFATGDAELEIDRLEEPRDRFTRFIEDRRGLVAGDEGSRYASYGSSDDADSSSEYAYDYAVSDFDRHGSWISLNGYRAWRPTVAADWRPYSDGYWRWSPAGLTWVSYEPWGWLPYHYGSWLWDTGFGWCWSPGIRYSPAWVYWNYTPSWVGWCPIGYYGGYYGGYGGYGGNHNSYYRSGRNRRGAERWTHAYPHLRGRVEVSRIDPRGWNYTSVSRIGSRFDSRRDILGHERVGFRSGERGLVATTPLRIDRGRGGSATSVVQEAVRRVPQTLGASPRGGSGNDDITSVLRRDVLGAPAREQLRRSFVTAGRDPGYRPVPAEQVASPRRTDASPSGTSGVPSRALGAGTAPDRGGSAAAAGRGDGSASREPWRDGGVAAATRGSRGTDSSPRRDADTPLSGGFGRERSVRGDDGWRSPGSESRSGRPPSRTFDVPARRTADAPSGSDTPARAERRERAPQAEPGRSTAEPSARREAPASPRNEGWRGEGTPSRGSRSGESAPRPRSEPPARSYEAPRRDAPSRSSAPPSRSYEAPRSAPAPRKEAPSRSYESRRSAPAPRYEAPSRSSAPPSRSYSAPRSAPAPRYEAPSRSSGPSSRSYQAPSRSSSSSSRSSAPPSRSSSPSSRSSAPPSRSSGSPHRSAPSRG